MYSMPYMLLRISLTFGGDKARVTLKHFPFPEQVGVMHAQMCVCVCIYIYTHTQYIYIHTHIYIIYYTMHS